MQNELPAWDILSDNAIWHIAIVEFRFSQKNALRQELFGLTILSVFYLVHNGFNLSYMAQLEMVLTK